MSDKLLLIDGHSILTRAFYGIPELTNGEGKHTNAVYGFLNILFKELETEQADHLAAAFDMHAPTFRHKLYAGYKGTRKPMPPELHEQVETIQEVLKSMRIPILTMEGYEADDILGTIAKREQKAGREVVIISGDRDLLQLADERIRISIPKTSKGRTEVFNYTPEDVKQEWQTTPEEFIDLKALMGDTSDNIPGVPGMGPKSAEWIITHYHTIENAYEHALDADFKVPRKPNAGKLLRENYASAQLSKTLATICTSVPIESAYEDAGTDQMFNEESFELIRRLELKSLYRRFDGVKEEKPAVEADLSNLKVSDDPYLLDIVIRDAASEGEAFFYLNDAGLFLGLRQDRRYLFRNMEASGKLLKLAETATLYTLSLKDMLHRMKAPSRLQHLHFQDLSLAAYLLDPLRDQYTYKDLSIMILSETLPDENPDLETEGFLTLTVMERCEKELFQRLKAKKEAKLYRDIELPLVYTLYDMELEGVLVDREALVSYGHELSDGISRLKDKIYRECGHEFNINSPQQLGSILFEEMKLPGGKKTKTGYSTAADVLEKLAEDSEFVRDILAYRTLSKLNSTYAEGLLSCISEDGRIHGKFNQTVTATGRISSTDPNLQNIPVRTDLGRRFRTVFVAKPGCIFLDADYSQVELRILASLSGDEKLIEAYRNASDIHAVTASAVFHVPLSEVTPQLRRNAKAVNFGIVYGISAFGLSEGLSISRREAKDYIDRYFATYPDVKKYLDEEVLKARQQGYVTTLFGRVRPVPDIHASNFARRTFSERVAMNSPIQGTAADIMKIAMNNVRASLIDGGYRARIVLQVHDELLLEVPFEEADAVEKLLVDKMEHAARLKVLLKADAKRGHNWDEAH